MLDLFAGSGALGIEALSRGAAHATFVERDRAGRRGHLGQPRCHRAHRPGDVVAAHDVPTWLGRRPGPGPFDLALLDPPYAFDDWDDLLAAAAELPVDVVVIESDRAVDPGGKWLVVREKAYGSTVVTIVRRAAVDADTVPTKPEE